jgi:formamidopyrimidine-DNA glycosylase
MPEGPEVRKVADVLRPQLVNKTIISVWKGDRAKTIGFDNLRCPVNIVSVRSYGKKVIIDLSSEHMIIVSLGMEGRLQYQSGNHSHIRFDIGTSVKKGILNILTKEFSLYFDDYRYMGSVDIIPNANVNIYFKDYGIDILELALDEKTWLSFDKWIAIFNQKKLQNRMIGAVLNDPSVMSSVGNYLRSEILYYSFINPQRIVKTLTQDEWDRLRICTHQILLVSYSYGGFTIQSFISPNGEYGKYPAAVYKKDYDAMDNPISKIKIGTQTVHWVPAIQK